MSASDTAAAAGVRPRPFEPSGRLTTFFEWFADDDSLCIVGRDDLTLAQMDVGFCHALGHVGDRDLRIVARSELLEPMADRVAFLDIPVRLLHPTADGGVVEVDVPRRSDVFDRYRRGLRGGTHNLGALGPLVERLLEAIEDRHDLVAVDRQSYLSWHFQGRQVLSVTARPRASAAKVVAGVAYSRPGPGRPAPSVIELTAPITDEQIAEVIACVNTAVANRSEGRDVANQEHILQELLRGSPALIGLDASHPPLREVPATRPVGDGYIDLVGVDADGRVRILETKLGPDDRLVLQGLDYWIWATANLAELTEQLGVEGDPNVVIDYVVAEKRAERGLIGHYSAGQAEAIDRSIEWRFTTVRDWTDGHPTIERLMPRQLPSGARGRRVPRKAPPRWARRLHAHLGDQARDQGRPVRGGVFWSDPADAFVAEAAAALADLKAEGLDHRMVHHMCSSQAFALNLFAPLDDGARAAVARMAGVDLEAADRAVFEWQDADDTLHERTAASPHNTQVDVAIFGQSADGSRSVVLIEVKLTETDFNYCSAYLSSLNTRIDVCRQPGAWGGAPHACAQLRNLGRGERRRYDSFLVAAETPEGTCGCSFRRGGNQPMRNAALAAMLMATGVVTHATIALCAPNAHPAIWRRWAEAKTALRGTGIQMADLPADRVVELNAHRDELVARYLLEP